MADDDVEQFSRFLLERAWEPGMRETEWILGAATKNANAARLREQLGATSPTQQAALVEIVEGALLACLHDLLYAVAHDQDEIQLRYGDTDLGEARDGELHGDLFDWLERRLPAPPTVLTRLREL